MVGTSIAGLKSTKPGEILNPLGANGKGRMRSLTDCMRAVGQEDHIVRLPDGTTKKVTFNEYVASSIKRLVADLLVAAQKGERVAKGLEKIHMKAWDLYMERVAPLDQAREALDGVRSLTVILSREEPHRPVEVVDVTATEIDGNG
jgi:hypothetical protein